ncbi:MAG: hypothetical protein HKM06_05630 [Spirochaetales bacterium]|nr:hypothetical protein [Spirochaetales bacterium]
MNRQGTITRIEGKDVWLTTQPLAGCGNGCGTEGGCNCIQTGKFVEFRAWNPENLNLKEGDFIDVNVPNGAAFMAGLRLLVLPLVLMGVAWFTWPLYGDPNAEGPRFALSAGVLVLAMASNFLRRKEKTQNMPTVVRVIPVMDLTPLALAKN